MKIKVLLVEDHTIISSGLHAILEPQADIEVVGKTVNGREAVELAARLSPAVVIMDVVLRGSEISGIEATRQIAELNKDVKVIALSVMEDLAYVKSMLAAGASGYLFKGCSTEELLEAIHAVLQGEVYFSEGARRVVEQDYVNLVQNPLKSHKGELTDREIEILKFVALGKNAKEIADRLDISRKTVDVHKRKIMEKQNLWSVAELTKYALREGIILEDE